MYQKPNFNPLSVIHFYSQNILWLTYFEFFLFQREQISHHIEWTMHSYYVFLELETTE